MTGEYLPLLVHDAADSSRMLGPGSKYGLGIIIRESKLGTLYGHDGGFPGYTSTMGYYPEHQVAAALMFNTDAPTGLAKPANALMTDLVEALISQLEKPGK